MKVCTCGHPKPDHEGWSGKGRCRPWIRHPETGIISAGKCDCRRFATSVPEVTGRDGHAKAYGPNALPLGAKYTVHTIRPRVRDKVQEPTTEVVPSETSDWPGWNATGWQYLNSEGKVVGQAFPCLNLVPDEQEVLVRCSPEYPCKDHRHNCLADDNIGCPGCLYEGAEERVSGSLGGIY